MLASSATLTKDDENQIIIPLGPTDASSERLVIELNLPKLVIPLPLSLGQDDCKLAIGIQSPKYQ